MGVDRFESLIAWQKARGLVIEIYRLSVCFGRDFALKDQIRRAAISIPSNIAEGFDRFRPREFHQFLSIAKGSCAEVRTHLYLARDAGYIDDAKLATSIKIAEDVASSIGALRASVERKIRS